MLSSPRKPPVKMFFPFGSFLLTHLEREGQTLSPPSSLSGWWEVSPVEVEDELHEAALEECQVPLASWSSHLVHTEHGPGVHRRIDVTELELIG